MKRYITLKHLFINGKKQIGLEYKTDKEIDGLIRSRLPKPLWSSKYKMVYIQNTPDNYSLILKAFKGKVWISLKDFEGKDSIRIVCEEHYKTVVDAYVQKLRLFKYSENTVRNYVSEFKRFLIHFKQEGHNNLDEKDIRNYLESLINNDVSDSRINLVINSIKFYYEKVLGMPKRFYFIERPRKKTKLPEVLSVEEVRTIFKNIPNKKHLCILKLLYSAGLRRKELINLKLQDINSNRMIILIRQGKGNKDRIVMLSKLLLDELREYYKIYQPKEYLFEGVGNKQYSAGSIFKIVKQAGKRAGISKRVYPHIFRHSFATHLLEQGTDIRNIQVLLGHSSSKVTEIYTHVATSTLQNIKSLLDFLYLNDNKEKTTM